MFVGCVKGRIFMFDIHSPTNEIYVLLTRLPQLAGQYSID